MPKLSKDTQVAESERKTKKAKLKVVRQNRCKRAEEMGILNGDIP